MNKISSKNIKISKRKAHNVTRDIVLLSLHFLVKRFCSVSVICLLKVMRHKRGNKRKRTERKQNELPLFEKLKYSQELRLKNLKYEPIYIHCFYYKD